MKSLMVTKFLPLPANSGGKIRSLAMLRELSSFSEVTLAGFYDPDTDFAGFDRMGVRILTEEWLPRRNLIGAITSTRSISAARFCSSSLREQIVNSGKGRDWDLLQIEYSHMFPCTRDIPARVKIVDFHNIESALLLREARTSIDGWRSLVARFEARRLRVIERSIPRAVDAVLTVTAQDAAFFADEIDTRIIVAPNGWEAFGPLKPAQEPIVSYVGLLSWRPNVDALMWFANNVWPLIRRTVPGARLEVAGRNPGSTIRDLQSAEILVIPSPTAIRPILERARLSIAPLRVGGGSRLKILEALDAGRPVVSTSVGAEGLEDLVGRGIVIADTVEDFGEAVSDLLANPTLAYELGSVGANEVRDRYNWHSGLREYRDFAESLGRGPLPDAQGR